VLALNCQRGLCNRQLISSSACRGVAPQREVGSVGNATVDSFVLNADSRSELNGHRQVIAKPFDFAARRSGRTISRTRYF